MMHLARFRSLCPHCGQRIELDDWVGTDAGAAVHAACCTDELVEQWHKTLGGPGFLEFMADQLRWSIADVQRWVEDGNYRP